MYNYLRELFHTFFHASDDEALEHEITAHRKALSAQLDQTGRKELLLWMDLERDRSDRLMFEAFLCGFRLAGGIAAELSQTPPFSFDAAEEQRGCRLAECSAPFYDSRRNPV